MTTLSESIEKISKMGRDVGEFKRNVGKVVIFLETFEYEEVKDVPSYEASAHGIAFGSVTGSSVPFSRGIARRNGMSSPMAVRRCRWPY